MTCVRLLTLTFGCFLCSFSLFAQYELGEATGYGRAGLHLNNVWALQNNQAGIAEIESVELGIAHQLSFALADNSTTTLALAIPVNNGAFGLSLNTYGFNLYKENKYGVSYGRKLSDKLNAGVQINFESINIGENYGNASTLTVEGGFQFALSENMVLSGHLYNPNESNYNTPTETASMSRLKGGFKYIFSEKVFVVAEVWKESKNDPKVIVGTEFRPNDWFYMRLGISNNPSSSSFGLGMHLNNFYVDLATDFNSSLGVSPNLSIRYAK